MPFIFCMGARSELGSGASGSDPITAMECEICLEEICVEVEEDCEVVV
jgi:hypothetical protein